MMLSDLVLLVCLNSAGLNSAYPNSACFTVSTGTLSCFPIRVMLTVLDMPTCPIHIRVQTGAVKQAPFSVVLEIEATPIYI